jgi:TM2 domain-containing membrane protein YozV
MENISKKSRAVTFILAFIFGVFGVHRFYVGKPLSAIFFIFTAGGFAIWLWVDLILILCGGFRDGKGLLIKNW